MEAVSYICDGSVYRVEAIVDYNFIEEDIATVIETIDDMSIVEYRKNMEIAVDQGYACSVYKDGDRIGFFYNRSEDLKYIGCSIWLGRDAIGMLLGLKTIFEIGDYHKIVFMPHGDNWKYFKSIALGSSIRGYHLERTPLVILKDDVVQKGKRMFEYYGVING